VAKLIEVIIKRAEDDKNYGVVLIPEGLVEFIPQMNQLISEINKIVAGLNVDPEQLKGIIY
jgi:pyrophosphate--fructose-6-phosphate 1-phosphotransferase